MDSNQQQQTTTPTKPKLPPFAIALIVVAGLIFIGVMGYAMWKFAQKRAGGAGPNSIGTPSAGNATMASPSNVSAGVTAGVGNAAVGNAAAIARGAGITR